MSEQTPPEFDFEKLMKQNLPDLEINLGDSEPSPELVSVPESKLDSPWKKPTAKQKEYFGGLIYGLDMPWPLYIIEDVLSLPEDYRSIKIKGSLLIIIAELYGGKEIYLPNGSIFLCDIFDVVLTTNLRNDPTTGGLVVARNPNVNPPEYTAGLSKAIIKANHYLKIIGDPILPEYPTA